MIKYVFYKKNNNIAYLVLNLKKKQRNHYCIFLFDSYGPLENFLVRLIITSIQLKS